MTKSYTAINWNALEDEIDKATWEKLTEQFWLDTRIPLMTYLIGVNLMKMTQTSLVKYSVV